MARPSSAPPAAGARQFRRAEKPPPGTVSRRGSNASSVGSNASASSSASKKRAAVRRQRSRALPQPATAAAPAAATAAPSTRPARPRPATAGAGAARQPSAASQAHRARLAVEADLSSTVCVGSRRIIEERQLESRVHQPLTGKLQVGTNALTESFLRARMGRQCVGGKSPAERGGAVSPWAWEEWEDEEADAAAAAEKVAAAKAAKQAELDREQGLEPQLDDSAEAIFAELDRGMAGAARPLTPERGLPARMGRLLDSVTRRHEQSASRCSIDSSHSQSSLPVGVGPSWSTSTIASPRRTVPLRKRLDELHSRRPAPTGAEAAAAKAAADNRALRRLNRFNRAPTMGQLRAVRQCSCSTNLCSRLAANQPQPLLAAVLVLMKNNLTRTAALSYLSVPCNAVLAGVARFRK